MDTMDDIITPSPSKKNKKRKIIVHDLDAEDIIIESDYEESNILVL